MIRRFKSGGWAGAIYRVAGKVLEQAQATAASYGDVLQAKEYAGQNPDYSSKIQARHETVLAALRAAFNQLPSGLSPQAQALAQRLQSRRFPQQQRKQP